MDQDDYFITGYTGFCPDMTDHIGRNYHKVTRDIMKYHPHLKTRLSDVHYPEEMAMDPYCSQGDCNYCYSGHSQHMPGYQVYSPPNVYYSCHGDGQMYSNVGYPEQAYPLSCSEWGSPCVSKHCNEMYAPCLERKIAYNNMMPEEASYSQNVHQRYCSKSKPCCSSCAKGGPCRDDSQGKTYSFKHTANIPALDSYRKNGVIPNYMGHIPGMQHSFGEPYGIAASRLLRRHFDELSRKGL